MVIVDGYIQQVANGKFGLYSDKAPPAITGKVEQVSTGLVALGERRRKRQNANKCVTDCYLLHRPMCCEKKAEPRQELADFKEKLKRTEKASLKALGSGKPKML